MRLLKRLLQRLLIFGLGIVCVWLIVFVVFETADRRLPWILAVAITYGVAAYVILPRAIRMGLKILKSQRVPSYTITGDGLPGDPVNVALVGTLQQLRSAFAALGWSEADRLSLASSWGMVRAFVLNSPYPTAPFSTLYLFGRGQDIGFQKAIDNSPRKRHHIRFWALSQSVAQQTWGTAQFWLNTERPPDSERVLWIGAGTRDTGLSLHTAYIPDHARHRFGHECGARLYRRGADGKSVHRSGEGLSSRRKDPDRTGQPLHHRRRHRDGGSRRQQPLSPPDGYRRLQARQGLWSGCPSTLAVTGSMRCVRVQTGQANGS